MTTFALVHGAGHGGWCWEATSAWLRDAGHEVWLPTLSDSAERLGESGRNVGLSDPIRDVTSLLDAHDLLDVTLVGHSHAGMVLTGAADRRLLEAMLLSMPSQCPDDCKLWAIRHRG